MESQPLGLGLDAWQQEGASGFGGHSRSELESLHKALSAEQITGRDTDSNATPGSGAPLKVESLEKNLKVLEHKQSDIVLWRDMPKKPAYNTVEEYNLLRDYGPNRGGFNLEGELPEQEDTTYERQSELVKFLGNTRAVTHQMSLVSTHIGSAIQAEVKSGTLWILRRADEALVKGDANHVSVEWNGLYAQHAKNYSTPQAYYEDNETVIDLRGASLGEGNIEEGVRRIIDNYGDADRLYAPPIVLSNFTKIFYNNLRQMAPVPNDTTVGRRITQFQSQFGTIDLKFDKFLNRPASKSTSTGAESSKAPNAPTAGSNGITVVGSDSLSKWDSNSAGDYFFAATSKNRYGESALTVVGSQTTVAAGNRVDIDIDDAGGTYPAESYVIYRSNEGASSAADATFYPLFTISTSELSNGYDGASSGEVGDRNRILPDTDQAFICEHSEEIYSFKQLAPLMKMDLAITAPAFRFMILLYGTPILYQPPKFVRFINIGTS